MMPLPLSEPRMLGVPDVPVLLERLEGQECDGHEHF